MRGILASVCSLQQIFVFCLFMALINIHLADARVLLQCSVLLQGILMSCWSEDAQITQQSGLIIAPTARQSACSEGSGTLFLPS